MFVADIGGVKARRARGSRGLPIQSQRLETRTTSVNQTLPMLSRGLRQTSLAARHLRPHSYAGAAIRLQSSSNKHELAPKSTNSPVNPIHEQLSNHAAFTIHVLLRWLKYTAVGLVVVGVTTTTAFEGVHMYVENVSLAPDKDEEVHKWQ